MLARMIYLPKNKLSVASAEKSLENLSSLTGLVIQPHSGFDKYSIKNLEYTLLDEKRFGGGPACKIDVEAEIATWFSHYSVWEIAAELNESILILEDDVMWTKRLNVRDIVKDFEGDILNFGAAMWGHPEGNLKNYKKEGGITKREWCNNEHNVYAGNHEIGCECQSLCLYCAHAYVVTPKGARKLIEAKKYGILPADVYIRREIVDIYDYYPWPAWQDKSVKQSLINITHGEGQ